MGLRVEPTNFGSCTDILLTQLQASQTVGFTCMRDGSVKSRHMGSISHRRQQIEAINRGLAEFQELGCLSGCSS